MTEFLNEAGSNRQEIFLFHTAGKLFGLKAGDVRKVIHMPELIVPPGMPSFLGGFINIEGDLLPVVHLSVLLGFSKQPIEMYTPLVILKKRQGPLVLIISRVAGLETVDTQRISSLDDTSIFNQCVTSSGQTLVEETFHLLSPERIMLAKEQQVAKEFQEMAQKRLAALETDEVPNVRKN